MFNKNSIFFYVALVLGLIVIKGCENTNESLPLRFTMTDGQQDIKCSEPFGKNNQSKYLSQLQFYIAEMDVRDINKKWHRASFEASASSSDKVALIGGVCGQPMQWAVRLKSPLAEDSINALRFSVGVPSDLNHLNPLIQNAPLNQPDMFWTWQLGHKFLRLELSDDTDNWIFHLGSTGCQSASPVRPPMDDCLHANRPEIVLLNYSKGDIVSIDLAALTNDIELNADNNCQSEQDKSACQKLLNRMGIHEKQSVFSLIKKDNFDD